MSIKGDVIAVGVVGVVLLGAAWYAKQKLTAAAGAVADAAEAVLPYVNPADSMNFVNQGVNWVGGGIMGEANWTLGGQVYDWVNGDGAGKGPLTLNPTSTDNIFYRMNAWTGQTLTGDKNWTLGGQIYDWLH